MAEELEATLASVRQETAFLEKYFGLRKRCEQMQQANEKMVNRLQHVKKIIKRHKREKRYLEAKLAEYGDNFKESQVPVSWEEDQLFTCLRQTEPPPHPKAEPDDELNTSTESKTTNEKPSALSSIQPILQAYNKKDGGAKSRKVKSEQEIDLNAPKKPLNVFQLFCKEQKQLVQAAYLQESKEEIAHHELTRRLAQTWNILLPEDKQIYYEMHEADNEKYRQEMKAYESRDVSEFQQPSSSTSNMAALHVTSQSKVKQEVD